MLDIERQYQVNLSFAESIVSGKLLDYANWRFRPSVEETLKNVLTPFDLVYEKQGESTYQVSKFRYSRITLEEGVERLEHMKTLYDNKADWETRKDSLRKCMTEVLHLTKIPEWPESSPIIVNKRKTDDYQAETIALEVLPGLYTTGSLYKPRNLKGKVLVILSPNGHFVHGR